MLQAQLVGVSGHQYAAWTAATTVPANSAAALTTVRHPLAELHEEVFFLDIQLQTADGELLSCNRYVFTKAANLAPLLAVPPTEFTVHQETQGGTWRLMITNSGAHAAMYTWLEDARDLDAGGYVYFDANYVCLLPGEALKVSALWQNVPTPDRCLMISAWNTEEQQVT